MQVLFLKIFPYTIDTPFQRLLTGMWTERSIFAQCELLHITQIDIKHMSMNRKLKITELNRIEAEEFKEAEKLPLVVVLDNIRSFII